MSMDEDLKGLAEQAKQLQEEEEKEKVGEVRTEEEASTRLHEILEKLVRSQQGGNPFSELEEMIEGINAGEAGAKKRLDRIIKERDMTELIITGFETYEDVQQTLNTLADKGYTWNDDGDLKVELAKVKADFEEQMKNGIGFKISIPRTVLYGQERTDVKKYELPHSPNSTKINFKNLSDNL